MNETHLETLNVVEKRLVKAYATTILGKVRTIADVKPENLQFYVELEIAEREITYLTQQ